MGAIQLIEEKISPPLYDVISAYPLITNKQLQAKKIKMAMALKATNNHYDWHNIERRYFLAMAKNANYSVTTAESLLDETLSQVDAVIKQVSVSIPKNFPGRISQPIFDGLVSMKNKLR